MDDTTYFSLSGQLWSVFRELYEENGRDVSRVNIRAELQGTAWKKSLNQITILCGEHLSWITVFMNVSWSLKAVQLSAN